MPRQKDTSPAAMAVCIINHNGRHHLAESLAHLAALRDLFGEMVVVDDASTDDSVAVAAAVLPGARIVELPRNGGPGAARNAGFAATTAPRILFLDNDVLPDPDVPALLGAALDAVPDAVMAMPRVVSRSNPGRVEYEGGDAHVSGMVRLRGAGMPASDPPGPTGPVGSLITCCFLVDRERWGQDELFDERLHIYLEDHELGLRARMRGLDLLAVPAAVCRHGEGTPGISIRATGEHTAVRIRHTILNRWQVILKLYEGRTLLLFLPYLAAFEVYQLAGCVALGWARDWWAAARALLRGAGDLRSRRRAFQRSRRRGDAAVLTAGPHPFNPALARRAPVRLLQATLDTLATLNWAVVRRLAGSGRDA